MCGIFGLIRNDNAASPEKASAAFVELGRLAMERGKDSAGFALTTPTPRATITAPTAKHITRRETVIDNVRIVKDTCSFTDLWDDDKHLRDLTFNRVAIGHTRWATQGDRGSLANTSPIIVGSLVGTHNGDISTESVEGRYRLSKPHGQTDTEVLYQAIDRDRRDRRKIVKVMSTIEGRAALAWIDRHHPDRVYLGRAALSPLSIAWDAEGNLYWASNPRWFRDIDLMFNGALGFRDITLVPEGTLLTVGLSLAEPVVEDMRKFTPLCRPKDARMGDYVVWRGFHQGDIDADKAQTAHKVAKPRYVSSGGWTTKTKAGAAATGGGSGWDTKSGTAATGFTAPSHQAGTRLPDYFDDLSAVEERRFTYSSTTLDQALAAEEPEEDLFTDAELLDFDDEVDDAVIAWAEEGCSAAVVHQAANATTPSEVAALTRQYGFSSPAAFEKFRSEITGWYQEVSEAEPALQQDTTS